MAPQNQHYCTLEWFSEAGSAPIRSAVHFYFVIDVRIFFQLLQKNIFDRSKKKLGKNPKNRKFSKFQKSIFWKSQKIIIWKFWKIEREKKRKFSKFRFFQIFPQLFFSVENIFWKSWGKNPDINIEVNFHCGSNRSTLSLWEGLETSFLGP